MEVLIEHDSAFYYSLQKVLLNRKTLITLFQYVLYHCHGHFQIISTRTGPFFFLLADTDSIVTVTHEGII